MILYRDGERGGERERGEGKEVFVMFSFPFSSLAPCEGEFRFEAKSKVFWADYIFVHL